MTIFEGNDRVLDAPGNVQGGRKRIVKQDTFGG